MIKLKTLKAFAFSFDGISVQSFGAGQVYDFPLTHKDKLLTGGYCSEILENKTEISEITEQKQELSEQKNEALKIENKTVRKYNKKKKK
jgi:hypothetical protein